jgi:hypothetical protein
MKKILYFLFTFTLLFSFSACGGNKEPVVKEFESIEEINDALGYTLLEPDTAGLTFVSGSVIDEVVGTASYQSEKSVVELRMTLDSERAEGLSGYENAGHAGAVEAPAETFSSLEIRVISNSLYYCEFSFTSNDYTCYLSLAETKTDFSSFSSLLIDYVNQLYNLKEEPDFIYAINPDFVLPVEEPEPSTATTEDSKGTLTLPYYDITLLHVGDSYTFTPEGGDGNYSWVSDNKRVAVVSPNGGTVTAVSAGTATLTCTSGDGMTAEVIVRVKGE